DERNRMLREHGMLGRDFPQVNANTVAAFALGDYEWLLSFEADDLHDLVDMMRHLRYSDARLHVRDELPFHTGRRLDDLADVAALLAGAPAPRARTLSSRRNTQMTTPQYDAILFASFGGPEGQEDVIPFLRNVTAGRGVPDERLEEVAGHYRALGGRSPINAQTRELIAALQEELASRDVHLPIYFGNRNWAPYTAEALQSLHADGHRRALALITSAYSSYSGCRQYREDFARRLDETG